MLGARRYCRTSSGAVILTLRALLLGRLILRDDLDCLGRDGQHERGQKACIPGGCRISAHYPNRKPRSDPTAYAPIVRTPRHSPSGFTTTPRASGNASARWTGLTAANGSCFSRGAESLLLNAGAAFQGRARYQSNLTPPSRFLDSGPMARAYVSGYKIERPAEENHWRSGEFIGFDSHLEYASHWATREDAESHCNSLNQGIEIPFSEGGMYILRNFKVEERTSDEFVIVCEGPFIPRQRVAR
jgi:hypothetical protein